jgi:hypothetical protein
MKQQKKHILIIEQVGHALVQLMENGKINSPEWLNYFTPIYNQWF